MGRPDLAENHTPQELARMLYDSLREKILKLPDDVLVYPAHGAGSMCGRNISADRNSTIGRERRTNYALQPMEREAFGSDDGRPSPAPRIFSARRGLQPRAARRRLKTCRRSRRSRRKKRFGSSSGAMILDTRAATAFCSGHIPGAINIGLGGQFAAWAGAVVGLDRDLILVADDDKMANEARMRLARVGIERACGAVAGGVAGWAEAGLPLTITRQITVHDLTRPMAILIVDVRRPRNGRAAISVGAGTAPAGFTLEAPQRGASNAYALPPYTARADTAARLHAAKW